MHELHEAIQLARKIDQAVPDSFRAKPKIDFLSLYDMLILDDGLRTATRKLYRNGHYSESVFAAFKYVNNAVKTKTGLRIDGDNLMRNVFSAKSPVLRVNEGTSVSENDEQQGYMEIFAGVMKGIRNPRGHEDERGDTENKALSMIAIAQHLCEVVAESSKVQV